MPKWKPKLFLASSRNAIPLAEKLQIRLKPIAYVIPWWGEKAFPAGRLILEALLKHAADADFAAVLFTAEELVIDSAKKEVMRPRENCVFELGLFMGALGLNPERSLLLRSGDSDVLTDFVSDLGGMNWIPLPAAQSNPDEEERLLKAALDKIKINIDALDCCFNHPPPEELRIIPKERLVHLETIGSNLLKMGDPEVLVSGKIPLEVDSLELAKRVHSNMKNGVKYRYLCPADMKNVARWSTLIRTLAAAPLANTRAKVSGELFKDLMRKKQPDIESNLNRIGEQLRVFFLPQDPNLEFCVHNAQDPNTAICYLRHSDNTFVEWRRGDAAYDMAQSVRSQCEDDWGDAVFQGSTNYSLRDNGNRDFFSKLCRETTKMFPNMRDSVERICFSNEQ